MKKAKTPWINLVFVHGHFVGTKPVCGYTRYGWEVWHLVEDPKTGTVEIEMNTALMSKADMDIPLTLENMLALQKRLMSTDPDLEEARVNACVPLEPSLHNFSAPSKRLKRILIS